MLKFKKSNAGFTMVEFLFVIVILSIMVTVAIPAYYDLVDPAACLMAEANVRTVLTAAKIVECQGALTGDSLLDVDLVKDILSDNGTDFYGNIQITENEAEKTLATVTWQGIVHKNIEYTATYDCNDGSYFSKRVKKPKIHQR